MNFVKSHQSKIRWRLKSKVFLNVMRFSDPKNLFFRYTLNDGSGKYFMHQL